MNFTTQQLKDTFLSFFKSKGHVQISSSKVIPENDPTLLFTNSGMVQFKNILTGTPTDLKKVCSIQRCIRAGGKHNDLDDVGKDTYHHTFFEMMGNWSFGDYFKKEAIEYAWEFLTKILKLDPSRLYVTYYEELDIESPLIWKEYCHISHILPENKKNNFWEMGEHGPCGPCTEIHYDRIGDRDASHLVNKDDPDVIEIWNIVFIEYNNTLEGLKPLDVKCIDTGIGLERLLSILNNVKSNYLIDSFTKIINNIYTFSTYKYLDSESLVDCAFRVVSDHVRTLAVCLLDGVEFSNEGQGYVMRRILRRAVRYGHDILGIKKGNLSSLVISYLVDEFFSKFGFFYETELTEKNLQTDEKNLIEIKNEFDNIKNFEQFYDHQSLEKFKSIVQYKINKEEDLFLNTLKKGVDRFNKLALKNQTIRSEEIFKLYDTYGFPTDLVKLMAEEKNIKLDFSEFEKIKTKAKEMSKNKKNEIFIEGIPYTDDSMKYDFNGITSTLLMYIIDDEVFHFKLTKNEKDSKTEKFTADIININTSFMLELNTNAQIGLIFNKTCFYSESGGQVGDTGTITFYYENSEVGKFKVIDTKKNGNFVIHYGALKGKLSSTAILEYDDRINIQRNHTGCHLFNYFIRKHINTKQKGSLVNKFKFRFDYLCDEYINLHEIEKEINNLIIQKKKVYVKEIPKDIFLENIRKTTEKSETNLVDSCSKKDHLINKNKNISKISSNTKSSEIKEKNNRDILKKNENIMNEENNSPNTDEIFYDNIIKLNDIEEYPDIIRLICVEDSDIAELCGGTHVSNTGDLYKFKILSDSSISKGTRRVVGITGDEVKRIEEKVNMLQNKLKEGNSINIDKDLPLFDKQELTKLNDENKEIIKKKKLNNFKKNENNIDWILRVNTEMEYKNIKYEYKTIQEETLKEIWRNVLKLSKMVEICSEFVIFFLIDEYVHGFIKSKKNIKENIGEGTYIINGDVIQFSFKNKYNDAMNYFKFIKFE